MFAVTIFSVFVVAIMFIGLLTFLLVKLGLFQAIFRFTPERFIASLAIISFIIAVIITYMINKITLEPIREVIKATNELAQGNYDTRIDITGANELIVLNESFNKLAKELSSVELLRTDFVNNFSHEFKTPIVSLKGYAKMLRYNKELTQQERDEYLDIIIIESERLAALSTNVLNLSKIENQQILTDCTNFRLDEQIRTSILTLESKWSDKNIELDIDMDDCEFRGNEEQLKLIWRNLLENAIKFSKENGKIEIELRRYSAAAMIRISDNGIGMDENSKKHIFDKFYQADTSHTAQGHGLGLTICSKVIKLHGGRIIVKSEIEKGTEFVVMLPFIK